MDKPKSKAELAEYMETVYFLAATEYVKDDHVIVHKDDTVAYLVKYTPFRNAVNVGFKCGEGEGFVKGCEYANFERDSADS